MMGRQTADQARLSVAAGILPTAQSPFADNQLSEERQCRYFRHVLVGLPRLTTPPARMTGCPTAVRANSYVMSRMQVMPTWRLCARQT